MSILCSQTRNGDNWCGGEGMNEELNFMLLTIGGIFTAMIVLLRFLQRIEGLE